ncbi:MAG: transglutaminase domain-containing protein [Ferruginibacter sp.]
MYYPVLRTMVLSLLITSNIGVSAQDKLPVKFGKVTAEDFNVVSPLIDSGTNAVVIAAVGNSEFIANTNDHNFSLVFKEKRRMKLINKNGFDAATVTIPLYTGNNGKIEKLEEFKANTYNIENGKVTETKVDRNDLFTEKANKHWTLKKFTFPAIKEGSILEYTYSIKSDFIFNFQPWEFQGQYPVLWSQYDAAIPEFFKYVILSQGYQPFAVNKNETSIISFRFVSHGERETNNNVVTGSGLKNDDIKGEIDYHTWIMKDVPALKEESYTTTLRNSVAKIEFQLGQVIYPRQLPVNYLNSWEKVATDLYEDEKFGLPIAGSNNWLDDETAVIVKEAGTAGEKTKRIYEYVRNNFTCNNDKGIKITTGLKEVFKNKSGSVADINMLLIAMLRNQKIPANPVILSTRKHGVTNEMYPLMDRYNYIIAKIDEDGNTVYLDASEQRLPFGKLPPAVYNGHAREIRKETAVPVYFHADSVTEVSNVNVIIANMDQGAVEGICTHTSGVFGSLQIRDKIAKNGLDNYKKSLEVSSEDVTLENIVVDSLNKLDEPVLVKYDMKLKAFATGDDMVYFNPLLNDAIKKNPFAAARRFYPVEMPCAFDDTYTFYMEVPKGYKVDELPKSVRIKFNEDEGLFEYIISANEADIRLRCRLVLKRANFANDDYQSLRDFYSFIVKKEAEQIVFKKK